jgi:hypothetical protein
VVRTRQLRGEQLVRFEQSDGSLGTVPVRWTDWAVPDPYSSIGGGRSRFRVEDLVRLADLVAGDLE